MRAKSPKRLLAESLRCEEGLSYAEIALLTGISKSTLSNWLRDTPLASEQRARLQSRLKANRASFAARAWPINRERHLQAREQAYRSGANVVAYLPDQPVVDELALAMLYLGEGSKSGGRVQMANTAPSILRFFLWALKSLHNIDEGRLSFRLTLVAAARPDEKRLIKWWAQELGYGPERFGKTQFDKRSSGSQVTDNYHGVCTVTYGDTYLQQRLLGFAHAYITSRDALKTIP